MDHARWGMPPRGISRRAGLAVGLAFCGMPGLGRALTIADEIEGDPVYIGHAIVTGTDNRDRPRGLRDCLREVLIKASGDPNIVEAKAYAAVAAQAAAMVSVISYHDRMSGLPHHDEQGSRDRPFDLTALFDKAKIAEAIKQLGGTVWTAARPVVFLRVDVHAYTGQFALLAGPATGYDQPSLMRSAIADASVLTALKVVLPTHEGDQAPAGMFPVSGSLVWSDAAHGWIAKWQARNIRWGEQGVSFDDAFDGALRGALGIASGHQPPRG